MIRAVVFSKDRPLQLDGLLQTIEMHARGLYAEVVVLYLPTSAAFEVGYRNCRAEHPGVLWVEQGDFRSDLLGLIPESGRVGFHCDDDLFYRPAPTLDPWLPSWPLLAYSLHLGQNTGYCYTLNQPQRVPARNPWPWPAAELDFGYPFSLDAHLYQADVVRALLEQLAFTTPNELEAAGAGFIAHDPVGWGELLACGDHSCVVSIPANRVQDAFRNRHAERSDWKAEALNELYLQGLRLDPAAMDFSAVCAAHQELELCFR